MEESYVIPNETDLYQRFPSANYLRTRTNNFRTTSRMANSTRQLAAIMFTDMVGYTALMQQNEVLAIEKKEKFRRHFEESISRHDGRVLQYYGDGAMSMFNSAIHAVRCAVEMQTLYLQQPKIDARIGLHVGEVMTDDAGAYGDGINIASRMESLAVPGSIFISDRLFDEIKNQQDIQAKPLGYFELKNVHQPMQVYAIANTGVVVPSRDEVKGKLKQSLNSLAVLPFVSLSADPENEFFCDGLSEELINVLSKIEGLLVTARTSAFAFKGKNEDVREIAGKLNVQKVMEGSVRKAANKVRITVQLINAADGYHIWSETYDRSLEDIFEVQDDISRAVANKMRKNLSTAEHEHSLVKAPTTNLDAYKKYLEAIHYWNKQTHSDIMRAYECFNEAVAIEPSFVNPYFNITYMTCFLPHAGIMSIEQARTICKHTSAKAMELEPNNARSHLAMGMTALLFDFDLKKAERHFLQAIELNPNLSEAHHLYAWFRLINQQRDQIEEPLRNAYRLDPMGGETVAGAGEICFLAGKFDLAEMYCNYALQTNPNNMYARTIKGLLTGFMGDWNAAVEILDKVHGIAIDFHLIAGLTGFAHAKAGNTEKATEILNRLKNVFHQPNGPPVSVLIALVHLGLGEKENFYTYYEEALRTKAVTAMHFYNSTLFTDVNGEMRLKELRGKFGLPE